MFCSDAMPPGNHQLLVSAEKESESCVFILPILLLLTVGAVD